jgi:hypothetical protein
VSPIRARRARKRLVTLARRIREWDSDRQRISHIENHEGGAFDKWWDSDDWAVNIVREVQGILGDTATAPPTRFCTPGDECEDCTAIIDHPPPREPGRAALPAIAAAWIRRMVKTSRRSRASRGRDLRDPHRTT